MIFLTKEEILTSHEKLLHRTGGLPGIRDMEMLESAVLKGMKSLSAFLFMVW